MVAAEPDPATGKRPKGFASLTVCPTCRRTKHLPLLAISGEIPDASSLNDAEPGEGRWPFAVVAGGVA
jgi:hypothetical protein